MPRGRGRRFARGHLPEVHAENEFGGVDVAEHALANLEPGSREALVPRLNRDPSTTACAGDPAPRNTGPRVPDQLVGPRAGLIHHLSECLQLVRRPQVLVADLARCWRLVIPHSSTSRALHHVRSNRFLSYNPWFLGSLGKLIRFEDFRCSGYDTFTSRKPHFPCFQAEGYLVALLQS